MLLSAWVLFTAVPLEVGRSVFSLSQRAPAEARDTNHRTRPIAAEAEQGAYQGRNGAQVSSFGRLEVGGRVGVQLVGPSQERVTGGRADSPRSDHALASQTGSVKVFVWLSGTGYPIPVVGNCSAAVRICAAVFTRCTRYATAAQQTAAIRSYVRTWYVCTILLCAAYNYVVER